MPYSATIDTHSEENDGLWIEDIGTDVETFLLQIKKVGGVLFPFHDGTAPFIFLDDIKAIWFSDGTGHVCDHCKEEETEPAKDLTIN